MYSSYFIQFYLFDSYFSQLDPYIFFSSILKNGFYPYTSKDRRSIEKSFVYPFFFSDFAVTKLLA